MGVSKNSGKTPQIILILIGFSSIIFTIHFGGVNTPILGLTPIFINHEIRIPSLANPFYDLQHDGLMDLYLYT